MDIKYHNKLVRDDVLMELTQEGVQYEASTLTGIKLHNALINKLNEEMGEARSAYAFNPDNLLEELADIVEVCYAIAKHVCNDKHGYKLDMTKVRKRYKKGGFNNGDYLESTIVDE